MEEIAQSKNKGEMKVTGWEGRLIQKYTLWRCSDSLSGELVPIISRSKFEEKAEKLLTKYCP